MTMMAFTVENGRLKNFRIVEEAEYNNQWADEHDILMDVPEEAIRTSLCDRFGKDFWGEGFYRVGALRFKQYRIVPMQGDTAS
jgi:hypothetical protein